MLKIRPEQIRAFQPVADAEFVERLAVHVRAEHADAPVFLPEGETTVGLLTDERLHEMVRRGVERARSYGITWESTLGAFVTIMFVAAPNFDEHPLIRRVLSDEKVDANARVERLWELTTEENWEVVAQNYDASAWHRAAEDASA